MAEGFLAHYKELTIFPAFLAMDHIRVLLEIKSPSRCLRQGASLRVKPFRMTGENCLLCHGYFLSIANMWHKAEGMGLLVRIKLTFQL